MSLYCVALPKGISSSRTGRSGVTKTIAKCIAVAVYTSSEAVLALLIARRVHTKANSLQSSQRPQATSAPPAITCFSRQTGSVSPANDWGEKEHPPRMSLALFFRPAALPSTEGWSWQMSRGDTAAKCRLNEVHQ
eukprot:910295-Pelagomonas_calceolata.AAC.2